MSVEHHTSVHALSVVLGKLTKVAFQGVFGFHNMSTGVKKLIVVYGDSTCREVAIRDEGITTAFRCLYWYASWPDAGLIKIQGDLEWRLWGLLQVANWRRCRV